ncbi:hypothetical protein LINPERPRIM_LOCUS21255 [Linum perenne]
MCTIFMLRNQRVKMVVVDGVQMVSLINRMKSTLTMAFQASSMIVISKLAHGSVKKTEKRLKK